MLRGDRAHGDIQLQLQVIGATKKEQQKMRREARKKVVEEESEDDVAEE